MSVPLAERHGNWSVWSGTGLYAVTVARKVRSTVYVGAGRGVFGAPWGRPVMRMGCHALSLVSWRVTRQKATSDVAVRKTATVSQKYEVVGWLVFFIEANFSQDVVDVVHVDKGISSCTATRHDETATRLWKQKFM